MPDTPVQFLGWEDPVEKGKATHKCKHSCTSLVAQLVKNLPSMLETLVQSLGREGPLEKGKATHSSILAWRILWSVVHGVAKSQWWLSNFHFHLVLGGASNFRNSD